MQALIFATLWPQSDLGVDVFPLQRNISYKYNYYAKSSYDETGYIFILSVDSGLVQYVVRGSISERDTAIAWQVDEVADLFHRRFNRWVPPYVDTSYWTHDTTRIILREFNSGHHKLVASGTLWHFPLAPLQLNPEVAIPQTIYRFADTALSTVIQSAGPGGMVGYSGDSLFFSSDSGFYRCVRSAYYGGNDHTISSVVAQLAVKPVVSIRRNIGLVSSFQLQQNYPNPFNPSTTIRYQIPEAGRVTIKIYNILRQNVATLVNEQKPAGDYSVEWNASNVPSGVYFYRTEAVSVSDPGKRFVAVKKMILLK